jgi:glyoxylase-like metal-dependent hydrolase (beta-lactamase superfamily II)
MGKLLLLKELRYERCSRPDIVKTPPWPAVDTALVAPGDHRYDRYASGSAVPGKCSTGVEHQGQHSIRNGQTFTAEGTTLRALFTPGHSQDHMCRRETTGMIGMPVGQQYLGNAQLVLSKIVYQSGEPVYKAHPDQGQHSIRNGQTFTAEGTTLRALFTPGHLWILR